MIFELYDIDAVTARVFRTKDINRKIGLTSGCFDLFHYYHLLYLERCRRQCDLLVVGVDSDRFIKEYKGVNRPIFPENHRARLVDSLKCVDAVFIMDSIQHFKRAAHIVDCDYIYKNDAFVDTSEVLKNPSSEVVIIPDIDEIQSTTEFIKKIEAPLRDTND